VDAGVPAGAVQDADDLFGGTGADLAGEGRQLPLEEWDGDRGGQMGPMEDRASRSGMDAADAGAPLKAVLHRSRRALAVEAPDFVQNRLEANAVLVDRPQRDLGRGKGGGHRLDERPQFFLQAAGCWASAKTWRGRGLRRLPSRRTRYAQPR
jgi:hypothetical protein